jgi:hypothetical protein
MKLLITIAAVLMVGCGPPQRPGISIYDAAWGGNIEAVKQHIAAGTDVNTKDDIGDTPLDVAIQLKQTEIAERLRKHGGKHGSLYTAAAGGDTEAVKEILAAGTDVNAKDNDGGTPLDMANGRHKKEAAKLLRKHGGKTGEELKAEGK